MLVLLAASAFAADPPPMEEVGFVFGSISWFRGEVEARVSLDGDAADATADFSCDVSATAVRCDVDVTVIEGSVTSSASATVTAARGYTDSGNETLTVVASGSTLSSVGSVYAWEAIERGMVEIAAFAWSGTRTATASYSFMCLPEVGDEVVL